MQTEFEFITKLKIKLLSKRILQTTCRVGIGDDCAVLPKDSKTDLVITTDLLVEDIDFRLEWTRAEFLGHKALAVSLSDVAAMGAKPVWAMLSIGVPESVWKTDFVDKFYDGWFDLAKKFDVELVGGDISKTPDKIVIDSIVAGETRKGRAVLRSGAKAGDLIYVTGILGGASYGLALLENGERLPEKLRNPDNNVERRAMLKQLRPTPQTEIGQIIGAKGLATAMIDLSDGLSSDLTHLCRENKVGANIYPHSILKFPKPKLLFSRKEEKLTCLSNSLNGGEDFELLFTVNPKKKLRLEKELKNRYFSRIGEITANAGMIELISDKKSSILEPKGFRHF